LSAHTLISWCSFTCALTAISFNSNHSHQYGTIYCQTSQYHLIDWCQIIGLHLPLIGKAWLPTPMLAHAKTCYNSARTKDGIRPSYFIVFTADEI
ncbi:hypothetical protein, partial [Uruburuella suis]|uniref:hypothetical protein n=1 Tax=Uruburuella suis TaxID=252130 RepID=UPI002491CB35